MTDVLSDILDTVVLKAVLYFRTDCHSPFSIAVPSYKHAARFHILVQGGCHVRLAEGKSIQLSRGDMVLIPYGSAHFLANPADAPGTPLADLIAQSGFTGQGPFVVGSGPADESCQMICGHFTFADGADHPLLRAVPEILHIKAADSAKRPMLDDITRLIARRMFEDKPGVNAVVSRLSEVLFIEILRAGIEQAPDISRLMSSVSDPQIGRALSLIHGEIASPWTVDSLAQAIGMSRSRFAERFRELVGTGPMNYVADWRLQRALRLLSETDLTIKAIAAQIGYQSAGAFARAFKEKFESSPAEYRQKNR